MITGSDKEIARQSNKGVYGMSLQVLLEFETGPDLTDL